MSDRYNKEFEAEFNPEISEQEVLEQMALIDEEAKNIPISENIKPENMMRRIDEMEKKGYFEGAYKKLNGEKKRVNKMGKNKGNRKKALTMLTGIGATVAAASLVAAILIQQPKVNDAGAADNGTYRGVGTLGSYAENMRDKNSDGVYVLSSYKELNEYMVAMSTMQKETYDDDVIAWDDAIAEDFENSAQGPTYAVMDDGDIEVDISEERPTMSGTPEGEKGESNSGEETDYSDTNVRTEGVAEADIVKTDGKYIYHMRSEGNELKLIITSAAGADSKDISSISLSAATEAIVDKEAIYEHFGIDKAEGIAVYGADLLVSGDKLVVVAQPYIHGKYYSEYCFEMTVVMTYDISDKAAPELVSTLTLEGTYDSCKLVNGYVYIFADRYNYDVQTIYNHMSCTEEEAEKVYAPLVCGEYLPAEDVYIADCDYFNQYHIIATMDLNDVSSFKEVKAVLGKYGCVNKYVSGSNIYIMTDMYNEYAQALDDAAENETVTVNEQSEIMRFSYKDGYIVSNGRVVINGSVGDEFDIDEYNGYLRIAVSTSCEQYVCKKVEVKYYDGLEWLMGTDWDYDIMWSSGTDGSALYVYDEELELVGSIPQLKENEQVYGVRFDGDVAYVVTYEQTDPLFSIDLSDPTAPKVMGALKIPGFSTYLHKWDDNKLIGLGYDEYGQVKISTFDITDKYDVKETDVYSLEDVWWSEALYNHKAIFISPEKNLIGFAVDEYYESQEDIKLYGYQTVYKIFSYVDGKLTEVLVCPIGGKCDYEVRGMYIGDYIYIVSAQNGVTVYNMSDFEKVAHVE